GPWRKLLSRGQPRIAPLFPGRLCLSPAVIQLRLEVKLEQLVLRFGRCVSSSVSGAVHSPVWKQLSATIRQKHSRGNRCEDIDSALAELQARKVAEIDGYLLSPVSSIPSKVADLLQLGTRRSVDLAESAIREMNREALNS